MSTTPKVVVCAALIASAAAACGSSSSGGSTAGVTTTPAGTPSATSSVNANGCTTPPALQKSPQSYSHEPSLTIARKTYTATIVTNCGTITVALDGKDAPHTVNSFAFLAGKGFFADTPCHRLTTGGIYVLQCGDPTGTGTGGPGYEFKDEYLNDPALGKPDPTTRAVTYPAGMVAMANSGPNTNGSQFFLVYKASPLGPNYTPFGHITAGLDVLKRIAAAGTDGSNGPGDGAPVQPVVIESFTVTKG